MIPIPSFDRPGRQAWPLPHLWAAFVALIPQVASADPPHDRPSRERTQAFQHIGTFHVPDNLRADEPWSQVTSAEIIDVSGDGHTLLYTDSPGLRLGFVDIRDPEHPRAAGVLELDGEPTSVAVVGPWALIAINTSTDFTHPSGKLLVVHVRTRRIARELSLSGQPDSIAVSPDGRYAAIAIENERDEDANAGLLPQPPAGNLQVLDLRGSPERWPLSTIDLTGLADVAPEDPEPEFVDINADHLAVVSLQENNHLVIIDLTTREIIRHFSAGSASVEHVDAVEEELGPQEQGLMELTDHLVRRREPDAVTWIDSDTFATANEGDYEDGAGEEGGSRGFTLFHVNGEVEYESGSRWEHRLVRAGHFPQGRAANKGNEPEGAEFGRFGDRDLLFIGSERANAVGVYDVAGPSPRFAQLLPTGIQPEGLKAIPNRNLLVVAAELDGMDEGFALRPIITIYRLQEGPPHYPMLISADEHDVPIPWTAISGLAGDPRRTHTIWAVSDSFLAQAYLYRIDIRNRPARITRRIPIGAADGMLDLEGVASRVEGGFWLASEGRVDARPNQLLRVDDAGEILKRVELPATLSALMSNSGFEGLAVTGSASTGDEVVWVAIQREWQDDSPGWTKLGRYEVASGAWTFAHYPLDPVASPAGGWVGLSEVTALPDGRLALIERDNQAGPDARIKRLMAVDPREVAFAPHGKPLPTLSKHLLHDLRPEVSRRSLTTEEKLEGCALTRDGRVFLATDNDGVDENYGETLFFELRQPR